MSTLTTTEQAPSRRWARRAAAFVVAAAAVVGGIGGAEAASADSAAITNINGDYTVPQSSQFTFEATGFEADGTLEVYLDGGATPLRTYALDASGNAGTTAPDYTRVPIASTVSVGTHTLTFTDGTTDVDQAITVVAPASVTVTSATTASVGGTLTVSGTGWTTTNAAGTALVGLKIINSTNTAVSINHVTGYPTSGTTNLTVWVVVHPNASGSFTATVQLPNGGTTGANGSSPAFTAGTYYIQALAGSIQTGDRAGSAQGPVFTVS